jgi:predicted HicB family RNase H-like nuclease
MKAINFQIPDELHAKIQQAAALAEYSPSMSMWIRTVLNREADKQLKRSK